MAKKDARSFGSLQRCYDLFICKDALHVAAWSWLTEVLPYSCLGSFVFAEYVGSERNSSEQVVCCWLDIKLRYSLLWAELS